MKIRKPYTAIIIMGIFLALCVAIPVYAEQDMQKVNINTADKIQLTTLKFVGEKLAERIITHRKQTPFTCVEDLLKVKGIGPKVLEANKDKITI